MSGLFKSKTERQEPEVKVVADPFAPTRQAFQDWITGQIGKAGQQYTGEQVAPMTDQEKQSLGFLNQYSSAPIPKIWQEGQAELSKTLKGEYDPSTSPYYQAVKAEAAANLADTQKEIASRAGGGGRYYTGARVATQGKAAGDVTRGLNTVFGQLAEQERARAFSAIPLAQAAGEYEEAAPVRKAAALQTYGQLPRQLQQAYLDAIKNEWTMANRQWPLSIGQLASGTASQAPLYGQVGYSQTPSMFSQIASPIVSGLASGLGLGLGGKMGGFFAPAQTFAG